MPTGVSVLALGLGTLAASVPAAAASKHKTVTVAVIDPLSGPLAPEGQTTVNAAKAGAAYLNAGHAKAKGVHYKIITRTDQDTPSVDAALSRQLTQQGIRYFIGSDLSSTGFAAEQPTFNQVHAISFSSTPSLFTTAGVGTQYPGIYQDGDPDADYVVPFVNYFKKKGVKNLAVLYLNYQDVAKWGQQAVTLAKKDGMKTTTATISFTTSTMTAQLRTLQASGANALLVYALTTTLGGTLVRGMNQIGWFPKYSVLQGPTPQQLATLPASARNTILAGPDPLTFLSTKANAQPTGLVAQYYKYYAPLAGEKKGAFDQRAEGGSFYFDAMLIIDQAIAKAGSTTPQKVQKALDSGTKFTGSRGVYKYGPKKRTGPAPSTLGVYKLTPTGCPTGICQLAPGA